MALILKRIQPFLQLADLQWMYYWQKYLKIYGLVNKRVKYLFLYSIIQMRNLIHTAVACLYQFFELHMISWTYFSQYFQKVHPNKEKVPDYFNDKFLQKTITIMSYSSVAVRNFMLNMTKPNVTKGKMEKETKNHGWTNRQNGL